MKDLKVVFMGTPDFAVPSLKILIDNKIDVVGVITQPDRCRGRGKKVSFSPVKEFALQHTLTVFQPPKIKESSFVETISSLQPDVIIVVAFGQILPTAILNIPRLGCINVHASLLPKYRGAAPIHWSIIKGEKKTGVTTMYMDVGLDTGDMLLSAAVNIDSDEIMGQLHDRLKQLGANLLFESLELLVSGKASRLPQNNEQVSYAPLITREHERIDWNLPAEEIHNLVRGLNPWPGAYCLQQDKILKVWQTALGEPETSSATPGLICGVTKDGILVETGKGIIILQEVQPECKRRMQANDCACGYCIRTGDFLG